MDRVTVDDDTVWRRAELGDQICPRNTSSFLSRGQQREALGLEGLDGGSSSDSSTYLPKP